MALGRRKREQQELWVATMDLPRSERHVTFRKLNQILSEARCDRWLEDLCQLYDAQQLGRPSIPPGV